MSKRKRRDKPTEIEQRMVQALEWKPQVEQTALLASPIYIGQAQGEEKRHIKWGAKIELFLSSLHVFWVSPPSCLENVFSFACQTKLSCNTGPPIASNFCCSKTEQRKLYTPPTLCFPVHWSISLYHLTFCWFLLTHCFFILFILIFSSVLLFFLYFLILW